MRLLSFFKYNKRILNSKRLFLSYYLLAVLPFALYFFVAVIFNKKTEIDLPDYGFLISSILFAPYVETLIFCWPTKYLKKNTFPILKNFALFLSALLFASAHFIFSERETWTFAILFWTGLIYVHAYDYFNQEGKSAIVITTCIHTAYNITVATITFATYFAIENLKYGSYLVGLLILVFIVLNGIYIYSNCKLWDKLTREKNQW